MPTKAETDAAVRTLMSAGFTGDDYTQAARAQTSCGAALLPLGSAPVVPCVRRPDGHDGLHETARGVMWADPDDEEG